MNIKNPPPTKNQDFWRALFNAESIAVIGAKNGMGSWGGDAMRAALDSVKAKPSRKAYPVNPSEAEVMGLKSFKTVLEIPGPVDLAVIVVPAAVVPQVMRQCAEKKVKVAVIISAGFAEVDGNGIKLQEEIKAIAKGSGMRFTGPNCNGHADMHSHVASVGYANMLPAGPMALLSQSGTLGISIAQIAAGRGIGISKFVSTGNEADLRMEDYLEFLATDDDTKIIATYIEGLREARRYYELAKEITRSKPIVALKSGTTESAAKAAKSHTGTLAGSDVIYTAAFKQAGVIRVEDEEGLCDTVIALRDLPLPKGNRVSILTVGGGFGVVTAEDCEKEGLQMAQLTPETIKKLAAILPPRWTPGNPVDMVGVRPSGGENSGSRCLQALMEDKNTDAVISLLPPMLVPPGPMDNIKPEQLRAMLKETEKEQAALYEQVRRNDKPLVYIRRIVFSFQSQIPKNEMPKLPIPEYPHPRRAARVLRQLAEYRRYLEGS